MRLLFLDLETTGLVAKNNSILNIAAELHVDRKVVTSFEGTGFDKSATVNLGALKVNHYSLSEIDGMKSEELLLFNFCNWLLEQARQGPIVVAGHNPGFDVDFLKERLAKNNVVGLEELISYKQIDTAAIGRFLVLTKRLDADIVGSCSLVKLATALGIDLSKRKPHTAKDDVQISAEALYKMIDMHTVIAL